MLTVGLNRLGERKMEVTDIGSTGLVSYYSLYTATVACSGKGFHLLELR